MKTIAWWTQGLQSCLLISVSSCLTVDHFPRTPVQDESLTLICSLNFTPEVPVQWLVMGGYRYSYDCNLDENDIIDNDDNPTNYDVTCDIQPNITYQYNLTIHRLQKHQHQKTWLCNHLFGTEHLNVNVLVRADQPVWTPGAGDYREGQLYNLTCSTNVADPVPSFGWWIACPNNVTSMLTGTSYVWENETGIHNTIAFLPNRTLTGADIWCKLNQSQFDELDSDQHTVNVLYPPTQASVRSSHEDLIAVDEKTETVIVSCQVSEENCGNPPIYNYTWTLLRDGDIPGDDSTAQNLTLSVNRSNLCLDNEYTCAAANILGEAASDAVNVTLAVAPELEQHIDTHYDVRYDNNSFALDCHYNAKPVARVLWKDFNDEVFEAIDLANQPNGDCNLMVYSSQRLQWRNNTSLEQRKAGSGFVTCVADNGLGGGHLENITINVQYGPGAPGLRFTDDAVYAGGTAAMTCLFTPGPSGTDGNPTVTEYTWLFGNDTLVNNNSSHVTFVVTSVTQEGKYSCYGSNHPVGGSIKGKTSQPAFLTVNVPPYLLQPSAPSDTVIVLYNDQNTSLSCLGAGKPEIDFNWYHNGNQVDKADFIAEKDVEAGEYLYDLQYGWRSYLTRAVGGAYFTCDNIAKYDGHYQCEAYNDEEVSNKSSPVRLITHYPAHWSGPVLHPTHYTSPGDNFTLLCDVCMKPRGNITWYLNGEPVRDNVSITDDGRNLTLTDVQLEDLGNYTCQVTNIILEESHTRRFDLALMQYGAPQTPRMFQVDDSTSRSLNVSWQPGSTGGYDSQTFTLCYVAQDVHPSCQVVPKNKDDDDVFGKSLVDLEANTTYQLQLHAENAHHGNNRSSVSELNHSTKVAPVIKVVDLTFSATRVTVTWVVEAGEPSHLTLVHCPAKDCDVTTQRSRRDVKATWRELATNIPPDVETHTYEAVEGESFDEYSYNRFNLWAYEPGLDERSNADDDNAIRDVPPRSSDGVDIGLVVGIVLAVVAAAALATGGFVYYRKKAAKDGDDHISKRPNYGDNNKGLRDDQVQYEDIDGGPRDHSVSSASSPSKEYCTYEDVTSMSIMATSGQHRTAPDNAFCIDVPIKLPFDEVEEDASYMGLHHHDNKDNNAYEELQVAETIA